MRVYYMFLVILLLIVLLSLSVKEGLETEEKVGEIYANYKKMDKGFKDFQGIFKSLAL
jgi:hypothetical protein